MLKATRISPVLDVARLAKAVSRPGIDPRTWVTLGVVEAVTIEADGVFARVHARPTGETFTARVAMPYAVAGHGAYFPIAVDDEVLVAIPSGDPDHGPVVIGRLFCSDVTLPPDATDHPDDVVIHVKAGQNIRIVVEDGGEVHLGTSEPSDFVALADQVYQQLAALADALNHHIHPSNGSPPTPGIPLTNPIPVSPSSVAAQAVKAS